MPDQQPPRQHMRLKAQIILRDAVLTEPHPDQPEKLRCASFVLDSVSLFPVPDGEDGMPYEPVIYLRDGGQIGRRVLGTPLHLSAHLGYRIYDPEDGR